MTGRLWRGIPAKVKNAARWLRPPGPSWLEAEHNRTVVTEVIRRPGHRDMPAFVAIVRYDAAHAEAYERLNFSKRLAIVLPTSDPARGLRAVPSWLLVDVFVRDAPGRVQVRLGAPGGLARFLMGGAGRVDG